MSLFSRSTGLWAAMLEGLLPALTAVRRAITASLQDEAGAGAAVNPNH